MPWALGDVIDDRYRLDEHLGTGGFADVWRSLDSQRDQPVALKLPLSNGQDRELFERFQRGREMLEPFGETVAPSTVVRYLDSGLDTEPRYLVFEYLPGETLSEAFRSGSLGSGLRRRVVIDLAETLDFLHRNGVVYLDLKPENVIIRRSGRPVVIDFNTAIPRSEQVDIVFEPDQFKPPELLPGGDSSLAGSISDVYSWGKLAFYVLSGVKVETEDVPQSGLNPREFGSACPPSLAKVVQRATRPDATKRHGDGTALAREVAAATTHGPRLLISHPSGVDCPVAAGDTMGRLIPEEPPPWLVLSDTDGHVSSQHARFERSVDGWVLTDTSVNGTYVSGDDGWTFALSEHGYRVRRERGDIDSDRPMPDSTVSISDGTVIAPVHPKYGRNLLITTRIKQLQQKSQ